MKKLYTFLITGILFFVAISAYSQVPYPQPDQVLIPENFEGTTVANPLPTGWQFASGIPIDSTTETPCEGNRSLRMTLNSTNPTATLRSPMQIASGEDIEISFAYKIIDVSGGGATPNTFGTIQLQYTADATASPIVWANYDFIDSSNHNPSTSCAISSAVIPGASVPNGAAFAWRMSVSWASGSGNYYVYFDDFLGVEQVDCIKPFNVSVSNVTFDSALVSWTDINSPTPTEWEIQYGPFGFPPNFNPPFGTIVTANGSPHPITGLDDGEVYDVYVRAICGPGDESNWAGPITFQTIAIGTDCNTPKEITALPYTDSSNTQIYGNSYSGSPGAGCLGTNFLQGSDVVYEYTTTTDDYLKIALSNLVGAGNVGVFVYQSCSAIGTNCYAGSFTTTGSNFEFDIFVTAGQTYYFVISTAGANSTTQYTLNITGFDCGTWTAPNGQSQIDFFNQQLSAFDNTRPPGVQTTNDFATLNWYENDMGAPGMLIQNTDLITLMDGDIFWVNQTLGTCDSPYLMVTFNEFDCLGQLAILTTNSGDEICAEGTTTLSATANTDNIFWYDNEFGGEVRGTGNTFVTDVINQTTSYWVGEAFVGWGNLSGQANPGPVTVSTATTNDRGLIVDNITTDFTLVSVQVFSTAGGGATTIELRDISGQVPAQTVTVSLPAGSTASPTPFTIPLDFELKSGESYRLLKTNGTGPAMIYSTSATYPYAVGNVAEVTNGSTASGTVAGYWYFYNWTIIEDQPLCESPRTEVIAVVNEVFEVFASAVNPLVCVNENATLNVSSPDTDYIYEWTWSDPSGSYNQNGAQIQPTIIQNTTFTVTGYNPITNCTSPPDTVTIEAIGAGEITVTPEEVETCVGDIIELFAGGVFHTFNDLLTGWTVTNSSTGPGNPAAAAWKRVNSPYNPAQGATSNDNSGFYIATADAVGPTGTVNTQLTSPSFNLVGVQNATVSFYHYYYHISTQSTTARVRVSTNGGINWTILATYTSNQGTATNFDLVTLNLNSYTGFADVRIQFDYTGSWGWWWAVDDVTISRDYTNGQVTWSGINNLFLDEDATVPYNGSSTNKLYFKSDTPGTFNYNVELAVTGCANPVTNQVTITVNETLPPTGPAIQDYITGQTLANLDVTGQNLKYYIFQNGQYIRVSPNLPLEHGATYYITQTLNNCESEFLEVTVILDCPAPTNLAINTELGAGGTAAAGVISWTKPAVITSIQEYYIEIFETANPNTPVFQTTANASAEFAIVTGLEFDKNFTLEIYSICDPSIPINSSVESLEFDTFGIMSTTDFDFNGFTFYPNPTSNNVTFENLLPINNLEVFSMTGQKVIEINQINANKVQVDFESLATGVYFTTVTVGESVKVVRIIRK